MPDHEREPHEPREEAFYDNDVNIGDKGKVRAILPVEPQNYTGETVDVLVEVVTGDNKKGIGRVASPPGDGSWVEEGELVYYTTLNDGPVPYIIHSTRPK
ncbi:MAG TPA: hypothetical protein GX509_00170 [Firmicutes bacterium]|nr:hypothetical protein [Bacillota bacterium]